MDNYQDSPQIIWRPDRSKITKMDEFRSLVNKANNLMLGKLKCSILSGGHFKIKN